MPLVTIYFQLHQPFRLHPDRDKFLWDEMNREVFVNVSSKSYLPALSLLTESIAANGSFKITLSMSGVFLEQAEMYQPEVIMALQRLFDAGGKEMRVEYLDETYYHSLSSIYQDPVKKEFRDQVSLHREKMRMFFGIQPKSFRNTELIYNNEIAETVYDMGYRAMLCEARDDMVGGVDPAIMPGTIFRARGTGLIVIPRNRELSDDIAFRFSRRQFTPFEYAQKIAGMNYESVMLGFDLEHMGEHIWEDKGIFDFWKDLPHALAEHSTIELATPAEIGARYENSACPIVDIPRSSTSSWADAARDTFGWMGTQTQYELFRDIESHEADAKRAGGELLTRWRHLTTSDHVYFLHERPGDDHAVHSYFNPYGGSSTQATQILTRKIDYFDTALKRFDILKRSERTVVLMLAPETGKLPDEMGPLAQYISGKSGGLGEVVSALCEGLIDRNIDVHLATLNLKKRFQRESHLDESQWRTIRYQTESDKIHLVSSSIFADLPGAYGGDPRLNAAEFQKEIVNNIIKEVRGKSKGRLIVHSHDWMAGGAITAYVKSRKIPILHTVHNIFTGHIPFDMLFGIDLDQLSNYLYLSDMYGRRCVDCQASAIKSATLINFVGQRFLEEVVNDFFSDRYIVPPSVRQEVKEKYHFGSALAIINAPSRLMYPENCQYLVRRYGLNDDVIAAKRENLVEFQKRTGLAVNSDAILFYWPSRLDPAQKGTDLLLEIILKFVIEHGDVQVAVVADGVGGDRNQEETIGRIAWASGGKISYQHYNEELSMLGFAAAHDVFGASLYEPCGQIDQVGNLFGATATNRDTGGYHDKIRELRLRIDGSVQDVGSGFLFRDYDAGGLWYGLTKSVRFHRYPLEIREPQIRRIMKEARERYDLNVMIAEYVRVYEKLNGGTPLA
ncbi:MAG: glycogen/starch synthase [Deltaproteobacteria bacterium]|nr:glycogen/starch synthase [Deltaproteobacteria bacterium]MBN2688614.1 glycogen/starch synthase [Deltaproteobacteria bacterium]